MQREYGAAVFIARLQPPHKAHVECIERALDKADLVVVVCGSDRSSPTTRNPWTVAERQEMIERCFGYEAKKRLRFVPVRDLPYRDTHWVAAVHQKVTEVLAKEKYGRGDRPIVLVGHKKDHSSFYLGMFPQWDFCELGLMHDGLNATQLRTIFFQEGRIPPKDWKDREWHYDVHSGVRDFMEDFRKSDMYGKLRESAEFEREYRMRWADSPFPPVFVTTDAVVIKSGHVLLIRRGFNPGKGLVALPGGFLEKTLWLEDNVIKELKEETRIDVSVKELRASIRDHKVFDFPDRDPRGRTITHAFHIKLVDSGVLPHVKGDSDAIGAFWCPLGDLHHMEQEFFADHLDMIESF